MDCTLLWELVGQYTIIRCQKLAMTSPQRWEIKTKMLPCTIAFLMRAGYPKEQHRWNGAIIPQPCTEEAKTR